MSIVIYKTQLETQVSCLYNSWCNFYELSDYSNSSFLEDIKIGLEKSEKYRNANINRKKFMMNDIVNNTGYAFPSLIYLLNNLEKTYEYFNQTNHPFSNVTRFANDITNGFLYLDIISKSGFKYKHAVCIRNGFLIDSIYQKAYLWKGKFYGYRNTKIEYAIDLDSIPPNVDVKTIKIDLI